MDLSVDIEEARRLLERAEAAIEPMAKANALEEAVELLESCIDEDLTPGERLLISNLRFAHTRRLLSQLLQMPSLQMDVWIRYVKLLLLDLKEEVDRALSEDPNLRKGYDRFVDLWRQELIDVLSRQ